MKALLLTMAVISISFFSTAQNALTVNVTGLKTNTGTVKIEILDADQKTIKKINSKVKNQSCQVLIEDLPTGTYAIQYYHDENDNGQMDTGSFGRPEEGYGYSNDARGFMGPADFEDQIFEIKANQTITMKTIL